MRTNGIATLEEPETELQPIHDELPRYSFRAAVKNALANGGELRGGIEAEVDQEMRRRMGRNAQGFWVPWSAPSPKSPELRNLTQQTGVGGIATIIPDLMFIDALRPKLCVARLGGQILDLTAGGDRGFVAIPVKKTPAQVSWLSESSAPPSESNMVVGQTDLRPRTVSAFTDVSRRMLTLGQPGFLDFVINDIFVSLVVAIDGAAVLGPGNNNQPLGLLSNGGIPSIIPKSDTGNGGLPSYLDITSMEYMVSQFNGDAPMDAKMGFLTSPGGRFALRNTDIGASETPSATTGRMCWIAKPMILDGVCTTVDTVLGYCAVASTQVPQNLTKGTGTNLTAAVFGNFNDLVVNLFSGFDCLLNPYLFSTQGVERVSGFIDLDVATRRPGSFCTLAGWAVPAIA
jgi:HK97 family phage major capsid protein